ncbi:MAG: 23S rRNA (pseudouridine(1915)-N(3))-methyltransferase RlmH [Gammaproteobacteria bacterium]
MQLQVVAVGNRLPHWAKLAWADYAERFPKTFSVKLTEIPTPSRNEHTVQQAQQLEWQKMQRAIKGAPYCIALDEHGANWTTKQLAARLQDWQNQYQQVSFLIGGPDGLTDECLSMTKTHWSLSRLTLPHALARIVLIEQLYRGISVLGNHPYHRE